MYSTRWCNVGGIVMAIIQCGGMEVAFLIVSRRSMYSVQYHDFAHTLIIMNVDVCELCIH